jgi:hypothetical protein
MLQLYDYLCIDPLPVPLLKDQHLARTNSVDTMDKNKRIRYRRANVLEARDTAAQFIIAINNNEYNLDDSRTMNSIFCQVLVILSNPNIFTERLCHHTLTVVKKHCFPLLRYEQRCYLNSVYQSAKNQTSNSKTLFNDEQSLPQNFDNAFTWKDVYGPRDEDDINGLAPYTMVILGLVGRGKSDLIRSILGRGLQNDTNYSITIVDTPGLFDNRANIRDPFSIEDRSNKELYLSEANSARSGHFNTLPKRPKVDKYKHRCGPKAQKYR